MKIAFDISQTGAQKAGCGFFADALIRAMPRLTPQHSYLLLRNFGDFFFDPDLQHAKPYRGPNVSYARGVASRDELREYWRSPSLDAEFADIDILHANNFWCPHQPLSARVVYTLYDIHFVEEPSWTTEVNRVGCFAGVFNAAVAADFIIAISEFTRQHFLRIFPSFPADRIKVVYPCSRFMNLDEPGSRPKVSAKVAPQKFWLNVGTIEPRKISSEFCARTRNILKQEGPPFRSSSPAELVG